eukprot:6492718-Amphidinium_carterae.3
MAGSIRNERITCFLWVEPFLCLSCAACYLVLAFLVGVHESAGALMCHLSSGFECVWGGVLAFSEGQAFLAQNNTATWLADKLLHHVFVQNGVQVVCSRFDTHSTDFFSQRSLADAQVHVLNPVTVKIDVADLRIREVTLKRRLLPLRGVSVWLGLASVHKTLSLQCCDSVGTWLSKHRVQWKQWLQKSFQLHDGHWWDYDAALVQSHGFPPKHHDCHVSIRALCEIPQDRERSENFVDQLFRVAVPGTDDIVITNAAWRWETDMWRSSGATSLVRCSAGKLRVDDLPAYVRDNMAKQSHALLDDWVPLSCVLRALGVEKSSLELVRQICVQVAVVVERWLWQSAFQGEESVASTVHQQRKKNLQYVQATKRTMSGARDVSLAVDGTRVGKRKILLGVVGRCGTKRTALAVPQALHERLAQASLSTQTLSVKRNRFVEQQRAFVNREVAPKGNQDVIERKSTYLFLRAVEQMLDQAGLGSVLSFKPLPCESPFIWRSLTLSGDQEGVSRAAVSFLQSKLGVNIEYWPDPSHQFHNDLLATWNSLGYKGYENKSGPK